MVKRSAAAGAPFLDVHSVIRALGAQCYLTDDGLATAVFLATTLKRPLLVEGEPGVGKTEVAHALTGAMGAQLFRLQCHEGIDVHNALYDWDYGRQLLALRASETGAAAPPLFSEQFLIVRPLLAALRAEPPVVLLIDEIDRADDQFEAFLLELLGEFQITIPEIGTLRSTTPPTVILTSNRTRELHDALKRRCIYHWIDYPDIEREREIVAARLPGVPQQIAARVCAAVDRLRRGDLHKPPGVAETIAWAEALLAIGDDDLDRTLGMALKVHDDIRTVRRTKVLADV